MNMIRLTHPNSKSPVDCHPTQVENMLRNGWKEAEPKKPLKTKPKPVINTNSTKEK